MFFEPETAFLRRVSLGEREVVRAIYGAVRDRWWGTVMPELSDLRVESSIDSFRLTFKAACKQNDIDFSWEGTVEGEKNGTLRFRFKGAAGSPFLRNRIGLCVLHPITECAGRACRIEKVSGERLEGKFPREISPHQPFTELRAIAHEVQPGVWVEIRFEGDVFETENHRNWTDASFKTYSTPLSLPFPVEIPAAARVDQTVILRFLTEQAPEPIVPAEGAGAVSVLLAGEGQPLPRIGLCLGPGVRHTEIQRSRLRTLKLVDPRLPRFVRVKSLDQTTEEEATKKPEDFRARSGLLRETRRGELELALPPHAVVKVDSASTLSNPAP